MDLDVISRVASRWVEESFAQRYARLFFAMSMEQAKATLGFEPRDTPSEEEISKAYKMKSRENHPDRGGDLAKMVEVNIAKEILDGKRRPDGGGGYSRPGPGPGPRPQEGEPPPPRNAPWPEEQRATIAEAKSEAGVPNAEWKFVSDTIYLGGIRDPEVKGASAYAWVIYGQTSSQHIFVLASRLSPYSDHDRKVRLSDEWRMSKLTFPIDKDLAKLASKAVKEAITTSAAMGQTLKAPTKFRLWPEGAALTESTLEKSNHGRGIPLKEILLGADLVNQDQKDPKRKTQIEIVPSYNKELRDDALAKLRVKKIPYAEPWMWHDFSVRVNGKSFPLARDTIENLRRNQFLNGVFGFGGEYEHAKNITKLRGGFVKLPASEAITLLADALTSEPSALQISLFSAAEEWEEDPNKKEAARRKTAFTVLTHTSLFDAAFLYGMDPSRFLAEIGL